MKRKLAVGIIATYALMIISVSQATTKESPVYKTHIKQKTLTQKKLEKYIGDEYIAECISKSKYPYLIAAIGKVESDYKPQVIGDKGKSYGLFQIQPRYWGRTDDRIQSQVDACERILGQLISRHGLERGVAKYNGHGSRARQYSKRINAISREIEKG